jgi:pimeloyl-ACP methyl ester carboxylesterase
MPERRGFAAVNGTRLYYEMMGSGPPLVLVHGFSLDCRMWDEQMAAFASRHLIVRYDLRGFGQSPAPAEPYAHAEDLKALLEYIGIAQAAILGLSFGGGIAINFALAYPAATRALIPVSTVLGGYRWTPAFDASLGAVYKTGRRNGIEAAREQWLAHPLFGPLQERDAARVHFARMVADYSGWHWVNADPNRVPDPPAIERLEAIAAPTLVVVGEREMPDFLALAEVLVARISGARRVVLPGVGHMVNMEDPTSFNQVVLDYLSQSV